MRCCLSLLVVGSIKDFSPRVVAFFSGGEGFRPAVSREKGRPGRKSKVVMQQTRKDFEVSDFSDDEHTTCLHVEGSKPKTTLPAPVDAEITAEEDADGHALELSESGELTELSSNSSESEFVVSEEEEERFSKSQTSGVEPSSRPRRVVENPIDGNDGSPIETLTPQRVPLNAPVANMMQSTNAAEDKPRLITKFKLPNSKG